MRSRPNCYQIGNKACCILKFGKFYIKRISMLPGLKVFSLAYKCVFYRPENNAKVGFHGIKF